MFRGIAINMFKVKNGLMLCHNTGNLMRFRESSRKKNLTVVLEYKRHALRARGKSIYFEIQVETDKKVGVLPIRI